MANQKNPEYKNLKKYFAHCFQTEVCKETEVKFTFSSYDRLAT